MQANRGETTGFPWLMSCFQCHTICLYKYLKTENGDCKTNKHKNNLKRRSKLDRTVTDPTCSDTRKGETTQANRNLNWEKHHLPTLGILIVEPGRKKSLIEALTTNKKPFFQRTLTVRLQRPWGNRQFSLVEKAHVMIKRKIRMCVTHGLPWELVKTTKMACYMAYKLRGLRHFDS